MAASAGRAVRDVYGWVTLAGMDVALPLTVLREVVPCPDELAALPTAAPGLLGAMSLRSLVLPVLDLGPALGRPSERRPGQVVVVVAHGDSVLGLLADTVHGVTAVPAAACTPTSTAGADLLFSATFRHPDTSTLVSVLDASAVLRIPGVPTVRDLPGGGAPGEDHPTSVGAPRRGAGVRRTLTLLRCGTYVLALDVAQVHTTLASSAASPSVLDSGLCRGVLPFAGRHVPVADPLVLLGLGQLPADDQGAGVVLDFGEGYVALALSELLDLVELPAEDVLPVPAFAVRRPDLLAGMADVPGVGHCLVVDGAALLADVDLRGLAAVNTDLGTSRDEGDPAPAAHAGDAALVGGGAPYLTYAVGIDLVTSLEQVTEILPVPTGSTQTAAGEAVLGVVVHRGVVVPLLCLATLLGRARGPVTPTSALLLVQVDQEQVGFLVDALRATGPLVWSDPDAETRQASHPARVLSSCRLVRVGEDPRLLPELDLRALGRLVRGERTHAEPSPVGLRRR